MIARRSDWRPRASLGKGRSSPATACFSQTAWTCSRRHFGIGEALVDVVPEGGLRAGAPRVEAVLGAVHDDEARVLLWIAVGASLEGRELVARHRHPEREEDDLAVDRPDALRGRDRVAQVLLRRPVDPARIEPAAMAAVAAAAHVGERDEPGPRERAIRLRRAPGRRCYGGSQHHARHDRGDRKEALHVS